MLPDLSPSSSRTSSIDLRALLLPSAILALALAVMAHVAVPRYQWRSVERNSTALLKIDRWTGKTEHGWVMSDWGRWVSTAELRQFYGVQSQQ